MPLLASRAECAGAIEIGLVNNMPDAALEAAERQFLELVASGAGTLDVRVHFFALQDVPRGAKAERHLALCYDDLEALVRSRLDAVIITGNEPKALRLSDEPYWGSLTRLFEWAERNTLSALFSCLSAHAAVLYFDGIERLRRQRKCVGVFEHVTATDHPLTRGLARNWPVVHSRWNALSEPALVAAGYRILSRSEAAGVNLFVRRRHSLFVLLQGHPEYAVDSLFKEYRRDVTRWLNGEQALYPELPEGAVDRATGEALREFRTTALALRAPELMARFPGPASFDQPRFARARRGARRLFANWLATIAEMKANAGRVVPRPPAPAIAGPLPFPPVAAEPVPSQYPPLEQFSETPGQGLRP